MRSLPTFAVAAVLYASCQCGLTAARQALLAGLVERARRTQVRAVLQSTTNAGLAVGAALGGLALQSDTREAYLAVFATDAVSFPVRTRRSSPRAADGVASRTPRLRAQGS
nr:MFS transporter [Streptomyces actinomycinicus]